MKIEKAAVAGTLESSDAQVFIEPGTNGLEIELESNVMHQYGRQIRELIVETLNNLNVSDARVSVKDKGALNCTLKARVETAVFRSAGQADNIPWGDSIK